MLALRSFALVTLLLSPFAAAAQSVVIPGEATPAEQQEMAANKGVSDGFLEGVGGKLLLQYSAASTVHVNLAPALNESQVDITQLKHAALPAGTSQQIVIDLTALPGWSPWHDLYYVSFSIPSTDAAEIQNAQIIPSTAGDLGKAFLGQLRMREPFQVSTPHALRGTVLFGVSLATIMGLSVLSIGLLLTRKRGPRSLLTTVIIGSLVYALWFGIDLQRFTVMHARQWYGNGIYEPAGSAIRTGREIDQFIREKDAQTTIAVCDRTTDYATKVLRYYSSPIRYVHNPETAEGITHVLVFPTSQWSYDEDILRCRTIEKKATIAKEFADGSTLFTLQP